MEMGGLACLPRFAVSELAALCKALFGLLRTEGGDNTSSWNKLPAAGQRVLLDRGWRVAAGQRMEGCCWTEDGGLLLDRGCCWTEGGGLLLDRGCCWTEGATLSPLLL